MLAGEQSSRHLNGVFNLLNSGDRAYLQRRSIHHPGIKLDYARLIEVGANASIKRRIIFQNRDGGFDGIQSCATLRQNFVTSQSSPVATLLVSLVFLFWDTPGSTVDDNRWIHLILLIEI